MIESVYPKASPLDRLPAYELHSACMLDLGRCIEGLKLLNPKIPRPFTRFNAAIFLIGLGQWPIGWHHYKARHLAVGSWRPEYRIQHFSELRDQVLIHHEQGYGDSLQFLRYALILAPKLKRLLIAVPPQMGRLTECLPLPKRSFIVHTREEDVPPCGSIPMMDLPALFDQRLDDIPAPVPYFQIPRLEIGRHRLPPTTKLRIGLCWAGHKRAQDLYAVVDSRRSVPFELVRPLLAMDKFQWVSLQQEGVDHPNLLQPLKTGGDWLDTAAVVSQLDLVISVDTAVAHLAGAINKPLWLLNRYDSCFRWGFAEWTSVYRPSWHEATPWYPKCRIFRQTQWNYWPDVIERILVELESL